MICIPTINPQQSNRAAKRKSTPQPLKNLHDNFVLIIPAVRTHARISFRKHRPEEKEELIEECIANAFRAYARLMELGKEDMIYPSVLANFAVKQVRAGRRVGGCLNSKDVYAQLRQGVTIKRLDHYDPEEQEWKEAVVEDDSTPIPEQVAFRVDFPAWLNQHQPPKRRVAEALALGYTTSEAAKRFDLSSGRISQLRREFEQSWEDYQGGQPETDEEESQAVA